MVNIGSDAIDLQDNGEYTKKLLRGVANNSKEVLHLLTTSNPNDEIEVDVLGVKKRVMAVPVNPTLFNDWLNPWAAKLGAALWYYHTGKIVDQADRLLVHWIPPNRLWFEGIPKEIAEILNREGRARQGGKDFGDQFYYRFEISESLDFGMFYVVLHLTVAVAITIVPAHYFQKFSSHHHFGSVYCPRPKLGLTKAIIAPLADLTRKF